MSVTGAHHFLAALDSASFSLCFLRRVAFRRARMELPDEIRVLRGCQGKSERAERALDCYLLFLTLVWTVVGGVGAVFEAVGLLAAICLVWGEVKERQERRVDKRIAGIGLGRGRKREKSTRLTTAFLWEAMMERCKGTRPEKRASVEHDKEWMTALLTLQVAA